MVPLLSPIIEAYRRAFRGLPSEVWWLSAAALVNRAGTMVLPFLSLYLIKALNLEVSAAKGILFAYGLGTVTGSWLGGRASDRWGSSIVQRVSLMGGGALFFVVPLVTSATWLYVAIFALSAVNDAFRPAVMTAVAAAATTAVRTRALTLLRLASNLGMAVGPATGGLLAAIDYQWLFVVDGISTWLAAAVTIFALRRFRPEVARVVPRVRLGAWAPLRDGPFVLLLAAVFMLAMALYMIFIVLPLYLEQVLGFAEGTIGWLLAANAVLVAVFEMVLISRLEHLRKIRLFAIGCALTAVGIGILPLGSGVFFVLLTVVVWSFGEMLSLPMSNAIVADRGDQAGQTGAYMGYYTLSFSLAGLAAPLVGLTIWDIFGPDAVWYSGGAAGLLLAAACWAVSHRFRRIRPRPETAGADSSPPDVFQP